MLEAATAAHPIPRNVLDLGCGTGALLDRAVDLWPDAHFVGIDIAPGMIAEARRLRPCRAIAPNTSNLS